MGYPQADVGGPLVAELEAACAQVPPDQLAALIGELERIKATAWTRLLKPAGKSEPSPSTPENGRYLSVTEVCNRFKVTRRWLYAHKRNLPHSQPTRKMLLFPEDKLARWFAARQRA